MDGQMATKGDEKMLVGEPVSLGVPISNANTYVVYLAFLLVGTGCGWFVMDALFQLLANEPPVQQGGKMYGTMQVLSGCVGMGTAGLYLLFLVASPRRLSFKAQQRVVTALILCTVTTLAMLMGFWQAGAPDYPVVVLSGALGNLVANSTYFFLFPLVTAYYGGWLIAPVRAGTDLSTLITTLLAEAENPTGNRDLFEPWVLFLVYTLLASAGLIVWQFIIRWNIGLTVDPSGCGAIENADAWELSAEVSFEEESSNASEEDEDESQEDQEASCPERLGAATKLLQQSLKRLACPRSLVGPVFVALLVETAQWGILISLGQMAAASTDPAGCSGPTGRSIYRTALTLNRALLPLASIASSLGWCPRALFNILGLSQMAAAATVCTIVAGMARSFWTSATGQFIYIGLYAAVGALEGYVLTMAYRYIGDTPGLSQKERQNGSNLLSFLSVVCVNPVGIAVGSLVDHGTIRCIDP